MSSDIESVIARAKEQYQKGDLSQALKILAPYQDNEKVQHIIKGIQAKQKTVQAPKKKTSSNMKQYALLLIVGILIGGLIGAGAMYSYENERLYHLDDVLQMNVLDSFVTACVRSTNWTESHCNDSMITIIGGDFNTAFACYHAKRFVSDTSMIDCITN